MQALRRVLPNAGSDDPIVRQRSSPSPKRSLAYPAAPAPPQSCLWEAYWPGRLPRYKSEAALKYRFGWKKSEQIHYYTDLLGMSDTICEEDLLGQENKTELEKRLAHTEQERELLREQITTMNLQMTKISAAVDALASKVGGHVIRPIAS